MQVPNKRDSLEQLHREIAETHPTIENNTTREVLGGVKSELQRVLTLPDEDQIEEHPTLIEQLREATVHLETDHPALAAAIQSAIDILSNSGI